MSNIDIAFEFAVAAAFLVAAVAFRMRLSAVDRHQKQLIVNWSRRSFRQRK